MAAPRLALAARRDKCTERTTVNFPFQLKTHIEDYARRKGFTFNQAVKELLSRGLHVEHYNREQWFVEPLHGAE